MHELTVLMVGLSTDQARLCIEILESEHSGLRVSECSGLDQEVAGPLSGRFDLALVACLNRSQQSLDFLNANRAGARLPVIALIESFDPEWTNLLLAAGVNRLVLPDRLKSDLLECVQSLRASERRPGHPDGMDMEKQLHQLLEAPNFFETVLANIPAMVVVLSLDGRIVVFNRTCEEVSGFTSAEVLGRLISEVFLLPEEIRGLQEVYEKLKQGRFPIHHQNAWLTKDGRTRQIYWSNAVALYAASGDIVFVVGMGQDITEEVNRRDELRELENYFERIFHSTPVGIGLVRYQDRIVVDANKSLLAVLGRKREEVVGLPADQIGLFPEQGAAEILDLVARQGPIDNREWRVPGKGRRPLHVLVTMEVIEWVQEMTIMVIVRDITERVQAEEKIRRLNDELERRVLERTRALEAINREMQSEVEFRKAIESSSQRLSQIIWELPDVIATCDLGGWFQYINKTGRRLYGLSEIEPISHLSVYQMYPPDLLVRVTAEVVPQVQQTGQWRGEIELQLPDGSRIPIMQTILAHHNGSGTVEFFSTIIRDITAERQAAEQIQLAFQTEKEMSQFRTSFFSMTSHQFRTPLSTILSSAELLENYADQWDLGKRQLHLSRIQEQVQLLIEMLNDILDIGRLEMKSDEIKLQPVDVCEIVGRRVEDCATVDDHRHSFSFDCVQDALPALSAPHLIDRVIDNLLSNAVKYSPQGTRVGIRVWPENGWAVIVVEDSGIGIPEAELPLLFTPFYRAGNSGDVSGSGLGLLIVKRSLELIGGEVRLESRLNIGTRVEVRIPLSNGPL